MNQNDENSDFPEILVIGKKTGEDKILYMGDKTKTNKVWVEDYMLAEHFEAFSSAIMKFNSIPTMDNIKIFKIDYLTYLNKKFDGKK